MANVKSVKASKIAKFLKAKLYGEDVLIKKPVLLDNLSSYSLSFIREKLFTESFIDLINKNPASLIICSLRFKNRIKTPFILSERAYYDFSQVVKEFFDCPKPKIVIGKNCNIKPKAILGGTGFSYEKNEDGASEVVTHIGGVTIGDNVDIGSWTAIDRGILTDTCIGSNVKIDNLVHVGHNSRIGDGTMIAAGAILGGAVVIGKNCFIGLNASIKQRVKIGDNAVVGMGAVVIRDIPSGTIVVGNPARPLIKNK